MMLNIPLPGGTSGHAVGAVLIALMLGPFSACITVSISLLIQALLFGDGGILSYGANCFNMAFILPFTGYFIFKLITSIVKNDRSKYIAAFISGYVALNAAAFFTSVEFGIQPLLFKDASGFPIYAPYPLSISIPAMMIPHLLVAGLAEGMVTAGSYAFIMKTSPGFITGDKSKTSLAPLYIFLLLMLVLVPLGLLTSQTAWGEWSIDELGIMFDKVPQGIKNGIDFKAFMPDYGIPVIKNGIAGYVISAITGTAILIIIFKFLSEFFKKERDE
jgi:cobalt/nickel transport system permease protein